jgi:hypothetical protein
MLICFLVLTAYVKDVVGQDTIWFLSGERLITSNYNIKVEDGMLNYFNKRNKEKHVGLEYVFSVVEKNGYKKIYYEPTVMDNTPFSVDQMWSFIRGEYEAHENYHPFGATLIGFGSGAGSVFIPMPVFYAPLVPALASGITGMTDVSQDKIAKKYPQYSDNEFFISGYREVANQKRVSNSIKGGLLGLVLGITSVIIISNKL